MINKIHIKSLDDYFTNLSDRNPCGVYFCRIDQYSEEVTAFLLEFMREINKNGIAIDSRLPNPDENQLRYYEDIIGLNFTLTKQYIKSSLHAWVQSLQEQQCTVLTEAMYTSLMDLRTLGKNDNIIKNVFVKYMCWLYYKFQRALQMIGKDAVPKILYIGTISTYEFSLLQILASAGCDVLLCHYGGEQGYLTLDKDGTLSELITVEQAEAFPKDFCIQGLQQVLRERAYIESLYDASKLRIPATNIWITGDMMKDSLRLDHDRGSDEKNFYNLFVRYTGVEDKVNYESELFHWKHELEQTGKIVHIIEKITPPTVEEVNKIGVGNYQDGLQMVTDLAKKIKCPFPLLRNQTRKAFVDCMIEEEKVEQGNLNRLKTKAIYLLCWFSRYGRTLFVKEKEENLPVLLYFGVCKNTAEALLFRFFASLPVDVILINPNLEHHCILQDQRLYDQSFPQTLSLTKFPEKIEDVKYGTAAYHAEQDLNTVLYQDSGMYRNHQYKKAVAVTLKTMYEELFILWDQEVSMRPNFEIINEQVVLPAIISKICGVKNADVNDYWKEIKKLQVEDTFLITEVPFYRSSQEPFDAIHAIKDKKLQKGSIIRNKRYQYQIFREEIQEHMLDKLQDLLDSGIMKGTFSTGMEYRIISVVMDLDKTITRMIQKMDFTKKIPKLVLINTQETEYSLEDSIVLAYLHYIGFDIALFVPTGYRIIEKYYAQPLFTEHLIGEFMYNMNLPLSMQGKNLNDQEKHENFFKRFLKNKV